MALAISRLSSLKDSIGMKVENITDYFSILPEMYQKLLTIFMLTMLFACSGDNSNPTYPFERSVLNVSVVKRCKNDGDNCYLMLQWEHPIEKKDLQKYYLWLDTAIVNDSVKKVSPSQIEQASYSVAYSHSGSGDSLNLTDLVGKSPDRDSLHIAIWAEYLGSEGEVQHFYVHFGDDIPPSIVSFSYYTTANSVSVEWTRPADQWDFYSPDLLNGPIAGYNVIIEAEDISESIKSAKVETSVAGEEFTDIYIRRFQRFRKDGRKAILEGTDSTNTRIFRFAIIDGKGFTGNDLDNWKMEISGLRREHSYSISIVAFDIAGNSSEVKRWSVFTTDPPHIASEFWFYTDSDGFPSLDSNRLI
jgi:hypothetical protein